jgi:polyphenol oxidase
MKFYKLIDFPANYAISVGDNAPAAESLGFTEIERDAIPHKFISPKQVHSILVCEVDRYCNSGFEADGLIAVGSSIALLIRTADCAPVAMVEPDKKIFALFHAGWRGTKNGIVENAVAEMVAKGCEPRNIRAYIGPTIMFGDYIVGDEFTGYFPDTAKKCGETVRFDLPLEIHNRLLSQGIVKCDRFLVSTFAVNWLHSYRRDGERSGRIFSYLWM